MKTMDLTVIKALSKKYFTPDITWQDFPSGMDGLLKTSQNELDIKGSRSVLLITDNANLIRAYINRKLENSYAVYIGDPFDIGGVLDYITDAWSPFDDGELLKKRYLLLLDYIKCCNELHEFTGRSR